MCRSRLQRSKCFQLVFPFLYSSLTKESQPQRQSNQRCQAWINQRGERDHNMQAHQHPSDRKRQQQTHCQAHQPSREEGAKKVERGGACHGLRLLFLAWMESPARKATSANAVSTCVRARMSCERAAAS